MINQLYAFFAVACCVVSMPVAATTESYILSTGDTIKIVVFEEADLSFDIKINESGVFSYPYLGDINLINKTTEQLEIDIKTGLIGRVLINPNVSVSISQYRNFSIGGEVKLPGSYPYEPGLNVKKAINLAGGLTEWSTGTRFTLDRARNTNETEKKITVDSLVFPDDVLTILPRRF